MEYDTTVDYIASYRVLSLTIAYRISKTLALYLSSTFKVIRKLFNLQKLQLKHANM